ncbi:deoxyribose-phosphate aldolase [Lottiidibacillus patelloidae]|uniref:Deoxyribose-phosphate aldolase n=1 Tax=Lottiidibacillus patelloidae TaxID=2670334 RepID=A0A263BVK2_9BACI|nr:deoxyribose-phosphate aldolase [Lottiidibacillus patelloidae]OZM57749.1 deoxyribose-phosphate aldolase [Lottiidibacillus patelloidae]
MATLNIEKYIDHTALKADIKHEDIKKLCEEAKTYGFYSVCVNPTWVATCRELLKGSNVEICTVIGFPLGATTPETKAFETKNAIENGATEVDMVINIGALKDGNDQLVLDDIRAVVGEARGKALIKVIIETSLLSQEEKIRACQLSVQAEADYVKTSTGFSTGGATVEDIKLMREVVGPEIGVKASGGVRDKESAEAMIAAGATRIGASTGVAIMEGKVAVSQY